MGTNIARRLVVAGALGAAFAYGCLRPTEIRVAVTAEPSLCAALETTIAAGPAGGVAPVAESSARASGCARDPAAGDVGSLVLVPSGDRGAKVEVRVLAGVGRSPDTCTASDFAGCVEARRLLRYIPHEPLDLPVLLRATCVGVMCASGTSCVDGRCFPYDPEAAGFCDPSAGAAACSGTGNAPLDAGPDAPQVPDATSPCPSTHGPSMVRVALPQASFCIDSTEVTNAQFAEFAPMAPSVSQIPACSANASWPSPTPDDLPVVNVSWCHANAFCAWAGKRLCKSLDSSRPTEGDASTAASEWYLACSAGGQRTFAYGDVYDPEICRTAGAHPTDTAPRAVRKYPGCVGGIPGVYDLIGNVHEWVDGCQTDTGLGDLCRTEGSSYGHPEADQKCSFGEAVGTGSITTVRGSVTGIDIGFRCCAD